MNKLLIILSLLFISSCTENQMTRRYGGTEHITLENKELVNLSWKQDQLWILTKPMSEDHKPITYSLKEKSSFGFVEGEVIIKETKR